MKKFTLVYGGARSGKSNYAVERLKENRKVVFIATADAKDDEMFERIKAHKKSRPATWDLIEEEKNLVPILNRLNANCDAILIDCLGLFVTNLMDIEPNNKRVEIKIRALIDAILDTNANIVLVSNDVGSGIVPMNAMARRFRDLLGQIGRAHV